MADEITRWSDELARDPSSLVFLQLGEALRRQGELDTAFKIAARGVERHPRSAEAHDLVARISVDRQDLARALAEWQAALDIKPDHVGAMKGLGYVCYQQGRFEEAERHLSRAAAGGAGNDVNSALATVRRSSGAEFAAPAAAPPPRTEAAPPPRTEAPRKVEVARPITARVEPHVDAFAEPKPDPAPPTVERSVEPQWMFSDLLLDDAQTALLLDANGLVLGGTYIDPDGQDVSQEVGARLSGISEEVARAAHHLELGAWRSMMFETHIAVVAMAPVPDDSLIVVAASRATPLGLIRRLLDRCAERAAGWLGGAKRP
ncbi:MAG TPA: tetratricopeptide repeat protein [Gemmatimonadaceae bacterium]|nr:tetratricopeptide repeat protein [Gemmatimonadaceae bacterium]